jgi:hypothetical protein
MILFCSFVVLSTMCVFLYLFAPLPVGFRDAPHSFGCYPSNLVYPALTTRVSGSVLNSRSVVKNAEFISAYAALQSLVFLSLTETRITPENTATPAARSSSDCSLIVREHLVAHFLTMAHHLSYLVTSTSPRLPLMNFFPTLSFPSLPFDLSLF